MAFYTLGLTFNLVILLTVIVLAVWIYGIYFNFKKWGLGSTGYHDQLRNSFWLFLATWIHEAFKDGLWVFLRTVVLDVLLLKKDSGQKPGAMGYAHVHVLWIPDAGGTFRLGTYDRYR